MHDDYRLHKQLPWHLSRTVACACPPANFVLTQFRRSARTAAHHDASIGTPTPSRTRGGAATTDVDVFDGLPIRRWTRRHITISQAPKVSNEKVEDLNDPIFPEYRKEMPLPKDFSLLPLHSQELLRIARKPRFPKYDNPSRDEKADEEGKDEEVKSDDEAAPRETHYSFVIDKWVQVPRNLEPAEHSYLAPRRKGLPAYGATEVVPAELIPPPMKKVKVKKVDGESGQASVFEALVPEGTHVEGEIREEDATLNVTVEPVAPGTVIEGVGVANADGVVVASAIDVATPQRRKPVGKRKIKGPGRGRKKKVMFAPGQGADAAGVHATADGAAAAATGVPSQDGTSGEGIRQEGDAATQNGTPGANNEDENDENDDDDDGSEGEEGDESGDESKSPSAGPNGALAEPAPTSAPRETEDTQMPDAGKTESAQMADAAPAPILAESTAVTETAPAETPEVQAEPAPASAVSESQGTSEPTAMDIDIAPVAAEQPPLETPSASEPQQPESPTPATASPKPASPPTTTGPAPEPPSSESTSAPEAVHFNQDKSDDMDLLGTIEARLAENKAKAEGDIEASQDTLMAESAAPIETGKSEDEVVVAQEKETQMMEVETDEGPAVVSVTATATVTAEPELEAEAQPAPATEEAEAKEIVAESSAPEAPAVEPTVPEPEPESTEAETKPEPIPEPEAITEPIPESTTSAVEEIDAAQSAAAADATNIEPVATESEQQEEAAVEQPPSTEPESVTKVEEAPSVAAVVETEEPPATATETETVKEENADITVEVKDGGDAVVEESAVPATEEKVEEPKVDAE